MAIVAGILAMGLFTGCGGRDGSTDSGGKADGNAQKFTDAPVTVFVSAPIGTPVADTPQIVAGARAAVRALNEEGGLVGHELKVEVCNDTDANAEIACARKAAKEEALAFAGSAFLYNPEAAEKALAKAKIPNVATIASSPVEYSQPINFPIDMPIFGLLPCVTQAPAATNHKALALITQNLPLQIAGAKQIEQAAKGARADYRGTVVVPVSQTDYSSPVQELADNGSELVVAFLGPGQLSALLQAATSVGQEFTYCDAAGGAPVDVLAQLGEAASDFYVGAGLPPTSTADKHPIMQEFLDQLKAEEEAGNAEATISTGIPIHTLRAWLAVRIIAQVAPSVKGELTGASLLAALNRSKVDLGGLAPPLDFSKPVPVPGYERAFNPTLLLSKWDPRNKEFVESGQPPQNALKLLAAGESK
jgi:ABC-type branched-subunit amino acid transport system substrate-binding protein